MAQFGQLTSKWSRRAQPSCAIMSLRRAAHLARYTDKTKSHFSLRLLPASGFIDISGMFGGSLGTGRAPSNIRLMSARRCRSR